MKSKSVTVGCGLLRMRGFEGRVTYELNGDATQMRAGSASSQPSKPLGGVIKATPEIATMAFREGRCFMTLEGGRECRLTVVAYTTGEDRAFVQAHAV